MAQFIIQPHSRLQEWIAHEKGYFRDEGLDYEFVRGPSHNTQKVVDDDGKVTDLMSGAFESYKTGGGNKGVKSDISCASAHWARATRLRRPRPASLGKSYVAYAGRNHGAAGVADHQTGATGRPGKSPSAITPAATSPRCSRSSRS